MYNLDYQQTTNSKVLEEELKNLKKEDRANKDSKKTLQKKINKNLAFIGSSFLISLITIIGLAGSNGGSSIMGALLGSGQMLNFGLVFIVFLIPIIATIGLTARHYTLSQKKSSLKKSIDSNKQNMDLKNQELKEARSVEESVDQMRYSRRGRFDGRFADAGGGYGGGGFDDDGGVYGGAVRRAPARAGGPAGGYGGGFDDDGGGAGRPPAPARAVGPAGGFDDDAGPDGGGGAGGPAAPAGRFVGGAGGPPAPTGRFVGGAGGGAGVPAYPAPFGGFAPAAGGPPTGGAGARPGAGGPLTPTPAARPAPAPVPVRAQAFDAGNMLGPIVRGRRGGSSSRGW